MGLQLLSFIAQVASLIAQVISIILESRRIPRAKKDPPQS